MTRSPAVFLVDVDDTLLENDRIQDNLRRHIEQEFDPECQDRFWAIREEISLQQLGYRDYIGAFQRFRVEHPYTPLGNRGQCSSSTIRLRTGCIPTCHGEIPFGMNNDFSAGDVVLQPRKVMRSGIFEALEGHVLCSSRTTRQCSLRTRQRKIRWSASALCSGMTC